jgi:polyisoprenoid-binding protein YceI
MEVGKYPQAQLSIKELILSENPLQLKKNLADQKFVGEMTFHGVTQPIEGVFALNPKDKSLEVHSEFKIKLSDFKIEVPTYMGIKVSDDVSVNVDYEISK